MEITGRKIIKFMKKALPTAVIVRGAVDYMSKNPYVFAKTLPTGERVYGLGMAIGDAITAGQNLVKTAAPVVKNVKSGLMTYGYLMALDSIMGLNNKARNKMNWYNVIQDKVVDTGTALPHAMKEFITNPMYGSKFNIALKEKIALPVLRGTNRVGKYLGLGNITKQFVRQKQKEIAIEKSSKRPRNMREIAKETIKRLRK